MGLIRYSFDKLKSIPSSLGARETYLPKSALVAAELVGNIVSLNDIYNMSRQGRPNSGKFTCDKIGSPVIRVGKCIPECLRTHVAGAKSHFFEE